MGSSDYADKDFYKVLGVPKDAKPDQIKKAFRKIARDNHPDQHPGDKAREQRFKEASEAHDVLSDPAKRKEYDAARAFGGLGGFHFPRGGQPGETVFRTSTGDANLGDIFGGLFGTASQTSNRTRSQRRGADVTGEVTIGFRDAVDGTTVSMQLVSDDACSACRGTGAKPGSGPRVCPTCQGSGMQQSSSGGVFSFSETCAECSGRGVVIDDPCEVCHGSGRERSTKTMQVRVPAGVSDGQKIRVKGRGSKGTGGGANGDLYVVVHVRPDPVFGRSGSDLTVTVPVTFPEAALGSEVEVPVLGGGSVKLRLAAGTPNGRVLRVRDKGIKKSDGTTGDLLVTVDVQVPEKLSPKAQELLKSYQAEAREDNPRRALLLKNR